MVFLENLRDQDSVDVKIVKNELFGYKAQERRHSLYEEIFKLPNTNLDSVIWNHSVTYRGDLCSAVPMCDQEDIITLTRHVRSFSDTLNILKNTFNDSSTEGRFYNCVRILTTASILNSLDKYLMRNLQTRFCLDILFIHLQNLGGSLLCIPYSLGAGSGLLK